MIPVDDKALRDQRITVRLAGKLAAVVGFDASTPDLARRYALGAMLDVWQVCHDRETHVLDAEAIDIAARIPGFAALLVGADLACAHPNGVCIAGARDRVSTVTVSPDGSDPESSNARARTRVRTGARAYTGARTQAGTYAPVRSYSSVLDNDHVLPEEELDHAHTQEGDASPRTRRVTRAEYRPVTDAFQSRFVVEYGKKPHWGAKEIRQVKDLVRVHGAEEVVRRVHVMFDDPPAWMDRPFTLATLVSNFDRFVAGASTTRRTAPTRDTRVGRYEPPAASDDDDTPPWGRR